jgi:hypothetical protein
MEAPHTFAHRATVCVEVIGVAEATSLSTLLHQLGVAERDVVEVIRRRLPGKRAAELASSDERLLEQGGLRFSDTQSHAEAAVIELITDETALLAGCVTPRTLALRLRVSESRIRHRIADGDLYAIRSGGRLLLPDWQFGADGSPLPGLRVVLRAFDEAEHPLGVQSFMTTVQADLESPAGEPMSPRNWLASGGAPAVVAEILLHERW